MQDEAETWHFDWGTMRGELSALGGMLGPVWFQLAQDRWVQPFAIAPWSDDPSERLASLPPLLRRLRGEWPCIPFGSPMARRDLPAEWMRNADLSVPAVDPEFHGFSSNNPWTLLGRHDRSLAIGIDYPESHPVRRLTRRIEALGPTTLGLSLDIEMRCAAELPIGLHPVFSVPEPPGRVRIDFPGLRRIATFPAPVEPSSVLAPNHLGQTLHAVPTRFGSVIDLTRHPLDVDTEELVLVETDEGQATLCNDTADYRMNLKWDRNLFPHCLIWISNQGRQEYPWNGRFRGIGLEPVASAFDLGVAYSTDVLSPLRDNFRRTAARLEAGTRQTRYSIEIVPLRDGHGRQIG
jgi:hypothetical protein